MLDVLKRNLINAKNAATLGLRPAQRQRRRLSRSRSRSLRIVLANTCAIVLFALPTKHAFAAPVCRTADASLSGSYRSVYTRDAVTEIFEQALVLRPNGQFFYEVAYGSMDASTSGCWRRDGARIVVTATAHQEDYKLRLVSVPKRDRDDPPPNTVTIQVDNLGTDNAVVEIQFADGKQVEAAQDQADSKDHLVFHATRAGDAVKRIGITYGDDGKKEWFSNHDAKQKTFVLASNINGLTPLDTSQAMEFRITGEKRLSNDMLGDFLLDENTPQEHTD